MMAVLPEVLRCFMDCRVKPGNDEREAVPSGPLRGNERSLWRRLSTFSPPIPDSLVKQPAVALCTPSQRSAARIFAQAPGAACRVPPTP